jgi:hypothetical protein
MMIRTIVAAALLLGSAYPLFLQAREIVLRKMALARYSVQMVDDATAVSYRGQQIALSDDAAMSNSHEIKGHVYIRVNGVDYSSGTPALIRTEYRDANRYWSWVSLGKLTEVNPKRTFISVIQRISPPDDKVAPIYRLILAGEDGAVHVEVFAFHDRAWPLYRTLLASRVSPFPIGFYSEVLQVWPNPAYPVIFPWGTFILGLVLVLSAHRRR